MEKNGDLVFSIKLKIFNSASGGETAFGPGVAQLLRGVEATASLSEAAKLMGMAYSKAWKILHAAEKSLGFIMIKRRGAIGSVLTPEGKNLLESFDKMQSAAENAVLDIFRDFLSGETFS